MITCIITYEIEPWAHDKFAQYARVWGEAIPRCGGDLTGYFAPHEGSTTTAYALIDFADLAAYEAYRARLKADPQGQANFAFAQKERFIRREDRAFVRRIDR